MIAITNKLAYDLIKTIRDYIKNEWYRNSEGLTTNFNTEFLFYKAYYPLELRMIEELQKAIDANHED